MASDVQEEVYAMLSSNRASPSNRPPRPSKSAGVFERRMAMLTLVRLQSSLVIESFLFQEIFGCLLIVDWTHCSPQ